MNTPPNQKLSRRTLIAASPLVLAAQETAHAETSHVSELQTFGHVGKQVHPLEAGKEAELLYHKGKGCLTHMWFGGDFEDFGKTLVRVYVDGEAAPSIEMELMMGIGIGFQDDSAPWGIHRFGKTGSPSGIYNTFRIPFGKSVRVTAQRAADLSDNPPFWWIVRGTENLPMTLANIPLPENARLRLHRLENYTVQRLQEFDICSTHRPGALYMVAMAAASSNLNYLEAEMRAYLNGSHEPLKLSSGLEDYFLGTYYFNRGRYYTPVAGLTHLNPQNNSFSAYRLHEEDPVFYQRGLRLTCRCGEERDAQPFGDPQATVYNTYVWYYEW